MKRITRREFIKAAAAVAAGPAVRAGASQRSFFSGVLGANDDIRIAVVGVGNKGAHHISMLSGLSGVRLAALCDVDKAILHEQVRQLELRNEKVATYVDARRLLDDKSIDAIIIATPNHWHALLTVWACQALKDVYVEKPVSHNVWEGRKEVEAARKYDRIVQAGTQSRSDEALAQAFDYVWKGNLGKIKCVRGFCYKRRDSIGRVNGPQPVPDSVDYNLWCGPAQLEPLMREHLHYDWHWVWPTGNGDIGNQGVHEMDMCRWVLRENALPQKVMSVGGRFGYIDDGQTPNTQIAILEYDSAPIIFEVRGLPQKKNDPAMDHYRQIRVGLVVECEAGYFAGGAGGGWVYDSAGKKLRQFSSGGGGAHLSNFLEAVRSRKVNDLNSNILEGHISSSLCHLANISYRIGQQSQPGQIRETIKADTPALETFERLVNHLKANEVDIDKTQIRLGAWLQVDGDKEKFVGSEYAERANQLLNRRYRAPFAVPEQV